MLCKWGEEEAAKKGWTTTLTASSLGAKLYKALGWGLVGSETIEADGEDEVVPFHCFSKKLSKVSQVV